MTTDRDVLTLQCPFCGHGHADEYECLVGEQAQTMKCAGCGQQFSVLVRECWECGEESVFPWKSTPAPETLALLSCNRCGAPFDEAAREGESPDPAQRI